MLNELRDASFVEKIEALLRKEGMPEKTIDDFRKCFTPDVVITIGEFEAENDDAMMKRILTKRGVTVEEADRSIALTNAEGAKRMLVTCGKFQIALLRDTARQIKKLYDAG